MDDEASDDVLIGRARTGDRSAFAQLYDRHVRPVFWQAYAVVGDATTAEDVTQETFVTAWRKLSTIPASDSALPWLLVTARYTALNHRRSRARHERRTTELPDDVTAPDDTEASVEASQVRAEIDHAVAALSEADRLLYQLCLEDDLTYAEAAERLGLTHASVRNRLSRLRARLRADLRALRETA